VDGKPKRKDRREEAKEHCWTAPETRRFLDAADKAGRQLMAVFALALDSGMRKGELLGAKWSDIDFENGKITVDRTLLKAGRDPTFGPTKTGQVRVIDLEEETLRKLRDHKRS